METVTVQLPEGKEGKKVKAVLKALGVSFGKTEKNGMVKEKKKKIVVKREKPYNPEFVEKILKSRQEAREGKTHKINLEELWK